MRGGQEEGKFYLKVRREEKWCWVWEGSGLNKWEFTGRWTVEPHGPTRSAPGMCPVLTPPSCCSFSLLPQSEVRHVAPAHWVTRGSGGCCKRSLSDSQNPLQRGPLLRVFTASEEHAEDISPDVWVDTHLPIPTATLIAKNGMVYYSIKKDLIAHCQISYLMPCYRNIEK